MTNMKYFILISTIFAASIDVYCASLNITVPSTASKVKNDCVWDDWKDGKCIVTKKNHLRRSEQRYKQPRQNEGKDCKEKEERFDKPCSESEYMAQVFLNTLTQGGKPPPGASSEKVRPDKTNEDKDNSTSLRKPTRNYSRHMCSTPRADPFNRWRISGRALGCRNSRFPAPEFTSSSRAFPFPFAEPKVSPQSRNAFLSNMRSIGKRSVDDSPNSEQPENQTSLANQTLDILFLIDESGSVGENKFKDEMRLMKETIKKLCGKIMISPEKTRVGLTTYDKKVHDHIKFKDSTDVNGIIKKLDEVEYNSETDGGTCLVNALQHARKNLFTKESGARENDGVYDMLILVTDGCANCAGNMDARLQHEVQKYEEQDITLMLVTISDSSYCSDTISKLAYGNHCFLNYEISDWSDFNRFVDDIAASECQDHWKYPDTTCP